MQSRDGTDLKHHVKETLAYSICRWLEMAEKRQLRRVRMWESFAEESNQHNCQDQRSTHNECH